MATQKTYVSLEKLKLYDEKIKGVISTGDAKALADAKAYADGLATNYDASGAATTAESNAKLYTDGQVTELKNGVIKTAQDTADKGVADAATAQAAADKAQGEVDALETYVGTFTAPEGSEGVDTVVKYIDAKTANIASDATVSALADRVTQAETDIDNIEKDYLKAADKTELEGKIATAQAAGDNAQTYAEGVADDLADEIKAREYADTAQAEKIATLEEQIKGVSGAMHFKGVETALPEDVSSYANGDVIIVGEKEYVFNGTAFVEFGDVSAEGDRIAALETHKTTYEAKVNTLEGEMDDVQAAVATKAEKTDVDTAIENLGEADSALSDRITTLEGKFGKGEGSVEDMIADAQAAAVASAKEYTDTQDGVTLKAANDYTDGKINEVRATIDTLTETVGTKAEKSDLDTLAGRVTTAEGKITTLEGEMDAVEALAAANKSAHEANAAAIALKASQADLEALEVRVIANKEAIDAFVEVSETEINNLFTTTA